MELNVKVVADDGRTIRMTVSQAKTVQDIGNTRRGGCSSVVGYRPSTDWIERPVHNIQMITNISVRNLYKRRETALKAIEFGDISRAAADDDVLKDMKVIELMEHFNARKAMEMKTIRNMLDDGPKNAHSQAHDTFYARISGVKIHLVTKKVGKETEVVVNSGYPTLDSIMVPYIELHTTVIKEGVHKPPPNSGAAVRIGRLIEKCLNKRSVVYKTLSLKGDNFEAFRASGKEVLAEDVTRFGDILAS